MKIIRGFSKKTSYNCAQCHLKCCAMEYDLPLLEREAKNIENYAIGSTFLREEFDSYKLLRGDTCPFLNQEGLCLLHDDEDPKNKPVLCRCYPLVYWKKRKNLILSWIGPCRGHGFQWVAPPEHRISDTFIEEMYQELEPHFNEYVGENFDAENPYDGVIRRRIDEELQFLERDVVLRKNDFIQTSQDIINSTYLNRIIRPLKEKIAQYKERDIVNDAINAVFHWLSWSPVGLSLNFLNAKYLTLISSLYTKERCLHAIEHNELNIPNKILIEQYASFMASAILPSFWEQTKRTSDNEQLMRFSQIVIEVLEGILPQEKMLL